MIESHTYKNFDTLSIEPKIKETLIRLPYRIGYWLSQSDNTGGDKADEIELHAMESLILSYGEDVCKSEFTQSVMEQTVSNYEVWDKWRNDIEKLPDECAAIAYLLASEVEPKQLNEFKESLFEIAETVALAYREIEGTKQSFLDMVYIKIRVLQKKWDALIKKYDFSLDHVLNISHSEEQALSRLKEALRI